MRIVLFVLLTIVWSLGCLTTRSQLRQQKEEKRVLTDIQKLQIQKADHESQMQEIEGQFRDYNGRIEVLENSYQQIQQEETKRKQEETLNQELLNNKFKLVEEALLKLEKDLFALRSEVSLLAKAKASKPKAKAKVGNFTQAEVDFGKKRWKEAILGYQKYRDLNPKGRRYSDATYKIGVCFAELRMKSEAKAFFKEVIEKFPKSRFSQKAQYRLKNLK